jgi:hypothetical protein
MTIIIAAVAVLALLNFAAVRFGVDSHSSRDWQQLTE